MECERVREEFIEQLTGHLAPDRCGAIDEHIARCPACRMETVRLRETWDELGTLHMPPGSGARDRLARLIDARARGVADTTRPARPSPWWIATGILGIAAALAIGATLGQRVNGVHSGGSQATASIAASPERYILLLHGPARSVSPAGVLGPVDSAGEAAIVAEYRAWAMRLRDSGALVTAEKLADEPRTVLTATSGSTLPPDSPDALGGFFLIQAADSTEALRIARACPHLKHGGTVEVRRIQPT